MRALVLLLLLAAPAAAEDLLPREGSGWAGFKPGTSVRIKRTVVREGRTPTVTISTTTLIEVGEKQLTLETVSRNPLGMEETTRSTVPRKGEAGPGETQETETLPEEAVSAAGRRFECTRVRTTVTGQEGRRVITDWIGGEPRMRIKRSVVSYDAQGGVVDTHVMLLAGPEEKREVDGHEVRCLRYRTLRTTGRAAAGPGTREESGEAWTSREVPFNIVRVDAEVRENGRKVLSYRIEAIGMEIK